MLKIDRESIDSMDKRYRTQLINSLWGVRPAVLVSTIDKKGNSNLAIFNSLMHIGAHPPVVGLIFRPDSVDRHTLSNILATQHYSINYITQEMIAQAHQTSARYTADVSEFEATGLKKGSISELVPNVEDSPVVIDLAFKEKLDIQSNGTHLVIGEVLNIYINDGLIDNEGWINHERLGTIGAGGLDSYYSSKLLKRMEYAKPDLPPRVRE